MYKEQFIQAIHDMRKIEISFYSKQDEAVITRKCAPMDYGKSTHAKDNIDRFHMWDYESDQAQHPLSLVEEQIRSMKILDETFDPGEFVTWKTEWLITREWGQYS